MNGNLDKANVSNAPHVESKQPGVLCTLYFKLPYLVFSNFAQRNIYTMVERYCKNLNIKLVFSSFDIKPLMNVKDSCA